MTYHDDPEYYAGDYYEDDCDFAEPGGGSALRAASRDNPRVYPCPNCGTEDVLTRKDVLLRYQCDRCANQAESGF